MISSDVDEIPSREALFKMSRCLSSLPKLTWVTMVWHHYAFNYVSRVAWGDLRAVIGEAPLVVSPLTAFKAARVGRCSLTKLRRAVRDQLPVHGASMMMWGGWHLQRFGGAESIESKLEASPYALDGTSSYFPAKELLSAGLFLPYPSALGSPQTSLADSAFDWVPRHESVIIPSLGIPSAAQQSDDFWVDRPVIASEATQNMRWSVVSAGLRHQISQRQPIVLVPLPSTNVGHPSDYKVPPGQVEHSKCNVRCGSRMVSSVEVCRWKLGLTRRVGAVLEEAASERCMEEAPGPRRQVTLKLDIQRTAVLQIDVNAANLRVVIDCDYQAEDGMAAGAQASALKLVTRICKTYLNNDPTMCAAVRAHATRVASIMEMFFVPMVESQLFVNERNVPLVFSCDAPALQVAEDWCVAQALASRQSAEEFLPLRHGEISPVSDPQECRNRVGSLVLQVQAGLGSNDDMGKKKHRPVCARRQEDLLDSPLRDALSLLQFRTLENQQYLGVQTWKFPPDLWVYTELIQEVRPTLIIEIGNNAGGSALYLSNFLDTLHRKEISEGGKDPLDCRMICVDIDHSKLHPSATAHPRATFIRSDGASSGPAVRALLQPYDKVMVIEDASHRRGPTLDLLEEFGPLVARGSYFIVEDTILHNGALSPYFDDPGAHASVDDFLNGRGGGGGKGRIRSDKDTSNVGGDFESDRYQERFVFSWNPTGFLRRVRGEGWGDNLRARRQSHSGDFSAEASMGSWVDDIPVHSSCKVEVKTSSGAHEFELSEKATDGKKVLGETLHFCQAVGAGDLTAQCAALTRARCLAPAWGDQVMPSQPFHDVPHPSQELVINRQWAGLLNISKYHFVVLERVDFYGAAVLGGAVAPDLAVDLRVQLGKPLNFVSGARSSEGVYAEGISSMRAGSFPSRYADIFCQWQTSAACRNSGGPRAPKALLELLADQMVLIPFYIKKSSAVSVRFPV